MRTTIMEVDTNRFNKNISLIKEYIGNKKIMPIIKANAYGTYINKRYINNLSLLFSTRFFLPLIFS